MSGFAKESLFLPLVQEDTLRAVTLSDFITSDLVTAVLVGDGSVPLPLVPGQSVEPGVLYEASDDGPRLWIPVYTLEVHDARFTSSLRWRKPDGDPSGPLAFLTLRFHLAPPAGGEAVREIPHQYTATLTSRVPVADGEGQGAALSMPLGAVQRVDAATAQVRFGITTKPEFDALWQAITDPKRPAEISLSASVAAGRVQRRPPRRVFFDVTDLRAQPVEQANTLTVTESLRWKPELLVPVEKKDPTSPDPVEWKTIRWGGLEVEQPQVSLPWFEAIKAQVIETQAIDEAQVMEAQGFGAQRFLAMDVPDPSADQWLLPQQQMLLADASPVFWKNISKFGGEVPLAFPVKDPVPKLRSLIRPRRATPGTITPKPSTGRRHSLIRPPRKPPATSTPEPKPSIAQVTLPAAAVVGPVSFPLDTNAYMFDVPGDLRPQTTRLLLRHEFDPGGSRPILVYYEDTAFPGRFYYEPQAFRVPRDTSPPYLPMIRVAFRGVEVDGGGAGPTAVRYRARLRYTVVPDLDDVVLGALRRELAAQRGVTSPDLTALLPEQATLQLELPDDAAQGLLATASRSLDGQAFDDGLSDEIELSETEFAATVALLQTDAIRGRIVADLIGAGKTAIPVSVSLRETVNIRLPRAYRGPVGGGLVQVRVSNPLESPVRIVEVYRAEAGRGVVAFPQTSAGIRVDAAGGSTDLDYRLVPEDADVSDVVPALGLEVDADLRALLPTLLVNSGYSAQTFALSVRTDPGYFGVRPPGAPGPLTRLLVEFDCDLDVLLDAATTSRDVRPRMAMLAWLLKDSTAQDYLYRVVSIYGDGDQTQPVVGAWMQGSGGGVLDVAPAAV